MDKLTNYYFIDESGSILNDSKLFIHGCVITDTPDLLEKSLSNLKETIENKLYYQELLKSIKEFGFHAVDNHPDIRKEFYDNLIDLNWRAFFVVINKESDYYQELSQKEDDEIFTISLRMLIDNRIRKRKEDINIFKFETIEFSKKSLNSILGKIFDTLPKEYNCSYDIVGKEEINMSIIDYLNYILFQLLSTKKQNIRMEQNFNIFAPKVALIHMPHCKAYLSNSNDTLSLENIKELW